MRFDEGFVYVCLKIRTRRSKPAWSGPMGPTYFCNTLCETDDAHDMFWQQRSRLPTCAECDALYEAVPILDDEGPAMLAVCEHYMLHRSEIEQASGGDDDLFLLTDRENASRIDRQRSSYNVGCILNDVYHIYCAGAPF